MKRRLVGWWRPTWYRWKHLPLHVGHSALRRKNGWQSRWFCQWCCANRMDRYWALREAMR